MAEKEKPDLLRQNAILVETIKKEQKHQTLHTEYSVNPFRKVHILPDNPMSRKPPDDDIDNKDSNFIKAFQKAREVPTQKYSAPLTESQEIGWNSTPLMPSSQQDKRLNFFRKNTDVTRHRELALRKGIPLSPP